MNSLINNNVTLGGRQTIDGLKTLTKALFVNNENINLRTNFTKGTAPSSTYWRQYVICDNSGSATSDHKLGAFITASDADGAQTTRMLAFKNVAEDENFAQLYIGYNSNGNIITAAPACLNTDSIVTTKARSNAANGYVKFGNQVTMQKGTMSAGSGATHTITFPTPFQNTNYKFVFSFATDTGELYAGAVNTKTTTNIVLHTTGGANTRACDWIAMEIY